MTKHGKKYVEAEKQIPAEPVSPLAAMKLLKEISVANFDETVTGDFRLGIDTRQADQQLRGTVSLPNGSGKTVRVAVFAEGAAAQAAEEAGADIVGTDELMQQIQAGEFNFDAAVATPDQMGKVGRLGKILGPRGLMPNPKLGTVTNDVAKAIKELKGGRVEYRADRYGIAHVVLGKVSFTPEQLAENYGAVYDEILRMKPAAAKGKYVKSITVSGTMTPGVSVDSSDLRLHRVRRVNRRFSIEEQGPASAGPFAFTPPKKSLLMRFVEGGAVGAQERDVEGRALHVDLPQGRIEGDDVAVDEQRRLAELVGVIETYLDNVAGIGDHGAGTQGMGSERHGDHALKAGGDQRAAG